MIRASDENSSYIDGPLVLFFELSEPLFEAILTVDFGLASVEGIGSFGVVIRVVVAMSARPATRFEMFDGASDTRHIRWSRELGRLLV